MFKQGKYSLKNPEKYLGDVEKLEFKSSFEEQAFKFCDNNFNVLFWGYEIIPIKYLKPVKNGYKPSIYIPDLYLEYINKENCVIKELIEIKPIKQTKKSRSTNSLRKIQENYVYEVNIAKWQAAEKWCNKNGIKFSVATEKSIFGKKSHK